MRFIHIADVHLGAVPDSGMPWGVQREKEIWTSFRNVIAACNENQVDLLLIAGDLFHKQPLIRELKEVNYLFSKLETARVVIMAGNHDYLSARSNYQGFEWIDRVHMFCQDSIGTIELAEIKTEITGFSYPTRDITEPIYDNLKAKENGNIQILLAHGGDEKNVPINKRKLMEAGFDYVALGHIHKPEIISEGMAYSGSLEPLDKNELGERGYILGEITNEPKRQTSIRFIPGSLRQYLRLILSVDSATTNGSLADQVAKLIKTHGEQHIYQFQIQGVRDEKLHFDLDLIKGLGNILEVTDISVPDYDFDALYRENSDNMIGLFIQRIRENTHQDEVARKALYYGIEALLGARDE